MGGTRASFYQDLEVPVLVLRGSYEEMGYQRGKLMGPEIIEILDHFRRLPELMIKHTRYGKSKRLLSLISRAIDAKISKPIVGNFLPALESEILGVTTALNIPYEDFARVLAIPDVMLSIMSVLSRGKTLLSDIKEKSLLEALTGDAFGCTSIAAWGAATAETLEGKLVVGRNLDYSGAEQYIPHPLLVLYEPDDGQRYIAVTSSGVPTAGITAMNESGITVAVHVNYQLDCAPSSGISMINIANEVVRRARSLEEAIDIAGEYPAAAGFTLFITSGDERKAVTVEYSGKRIAIRRPEGKSMMVQSNHYSDPKLGKREIQLRRILDCTHCRMERGMELLEEQHGTIGPQEVATILGDRFDPYAGRERALGNVISRSATVASVVMVPEDRRIYIARSPGQVSRDSLGPVSHGTYYGYTLDEIASGNFGQQRETLEGNPFPPEQANRHGAHQRFIGGFLDYYYDDDYEGALEKISEAADMDDQEPFYPYMKGLLEIIQAEKRNTQMESALWRAHRAFKEGLLAAGDSEYLQAPGRYLLGRTYFALEKDSGAASQLTALEEMASDSINSVQAEGLYDKLITVSQLEPDKRGFSPGEAEELVAAFFDPL